MSTNIRPDADAFGRIVENLVKYSSQVGFETTFQAGSAPLRVTTPMKGTLILGLLNEAGDPWSMMPLRAVGIVPGVLAGSDETLAAVDGPHVVGEFKSWHAAVSFALERACAPNWYAGAQDEHGVCAV